MSFKKNQSGFSLIELIVVMVIFTIVTGVILNNAPRFRDKTSLELVAQNIALNIRGAQVYGIGTKVVGPGEAPGSFGIHFNSAQATNFLLFADTTDDDKYTSASFGPCSDNIECLESYRLRGAQILRLCLEDGISLDCWETTNDSPNDSNLVDITYIKPQSEANFCYRSNYQAACELVNSSQATILITNASQSERRQITVWKNGQIAVETTEAEI